MATERAKEREAKLESTMYTKCLLLGLDPVTLSNRTNDSAIFGHFRHSNPRMGEQLLYFHLSALRGPVKSAKVATVPEDVGTTSALRAVAHHLIANDVLTVSGNLVCDVSPGAIASTHRIHGASVTTLMCNTTVRRPTEPGSSGGKDKAKKKSGIILWC